MDTKIQLPGVSFNTVEDTSVTIVYEDLYIL